MTTIDSLYQVKGGNTIDGLEFHTFYLKNMHSLLCNVEKCIFFNICYWYAWEKYDIDKTMLFSIRTSNNWLVLFVHKDRYLFCSGAYDGKVNLYSALRMELLMCYQITTMTLARNVNAVRFTSDGSRVRVMSTLNRGLDSLYVSINHF